MRLRPIAALSLAAVSALLLSACTGGGDPEASPSASAAADLCSIQADSGEASEAVTVTGDAGTPSEISFDKPLEIPELQVSVLDEGEGEAVAAGDFISYGMTAVDATTGDAIGELGYEEGQVLPAQLSAESGLGQILGCGKPGERVVATFPAVDATDTSAAIGAQVYVIDLLDTVPTAAWGEEQEPVDGMPTVTLDDSGAPTITVPKTDPPTDVEVTDLKTGDGAEVASGDTVLVQYTGVKWSDGSEFDSSWSRGVPQSFSTTSVVEGFKQALEGQKVGSQVLAVIPPKYGYGADDTSELKDETLVFVVDILGVQHATAAATE